MAKPSKNSAQYNIPLFKDLDIDQLHAVQTVREELAEKYSFDTVDFSDSSRPKTCLEVDFPILKVNEIAAIENNATKPIYMMSKWWARRRSSVFRQLLIAAATRSPKDSAAAAQTAWSLMYRKSHQKHLKFSNITVADIFMGGGTTVVEAARLGFKTIGIDLNPIAWWVVYNETHPVHRDKVDKLFRYVETEVRPQITSFFSAKSPRGFEGKWIDLETNKTVNVDPAELPFADRKKYRWVGSEVVYTFWMKHIMCSDPSCYHLTPQISSSIVSEKALKIKYYDNCVCPKCGDVFDLELGDFRMAPEAEFVLGTNESQFAVIAESLKSKCPHCKASLNSDWVGAIKSKKTLKSKSVTHSLLLPKTWLKGITAKSKSQFGGFYGATSDQDELWFSERSKGLQLIEVRGDIPEELNHSNFGVKRKSEDDESSGSNRKLICGKCGRSQEPLTAVKMSGHLAPVYPYMIQGFDPVAKEKKVPYGGRFFALPDVKQILRAFTEYRSRHDISEYVPSEELWFGHQTHQRTNLPAHGYTHWYHMFNPRQNYVNALLLKSIIEAPPEIADDQSKSQMLGAWQNYLRHNCMFAIWDISRDGLAPHFSNNDYNPKSTMVENCVFGDLGRGNFSGCVENVMSGLDFAFHPYDLMKNPDDEGAKSLKIDSDDKIDPNNVSIYCASSTDLKQIVSDCSVDMVITDPPFGDNVNYSELADFFLVWLKKPLQKLFPQVFTSSESPKTLEAVSNKARHPGETDTGEKKADAMYDRLLTLCWKEAFRILKPGGLLSFTFHHDKDVAWIGVLESLFKAGFVIEGAFPIRSDSTKGDGEFGSKKIEYDIVHVCRKRLNEPKEIFWATLRRQILDAVQTHASLLAQHTVSGLHQADLEVIIRGEVLEKFSAHYGKVFKNLDGHTISVREILVEANLIAQSLLHVAEQERIPDGINPETRLLFSLFRDGPSIEFNAARKRLKGSGVSLEDLCDLGWVKVDKRDGMRAASLVSLADRWNSLSRTRTLTSDLDQAFFAVNCCTGGRQLSGKPADLEAWIEENYKSVMPSVGPILKFIEKNHFGSDYKQAIGIAYRTLERTLQRIKESDGEFKKASEQMSLFGN